MGAGRRLLFWRWATMLLALFAACPTEAPHSGQSLSARLPPAVQPEAVDVEREPRVIGAALGVEPSVPRRTEADDVGSSQLSTQPHAFGEPKQQQQ
mmetsp:Transcript_10276/g.25893  ORF Transcript_10276/g.25893 Transcript_10276/m.25893 type:complete len:96 (-) Transcript_10276:41-328(-)